MPGQPWWRGAVGYQIYVRSFADSDGDGIGDLAGIRSRLPHLAELGVDLVWITPFYPSPGFDHGYDVADYRDVDPAHGTLQDFDDLVAEAHRLGLRVMIDIVPNHTSSAHPWFRAAVADPEGRYRGYYHWRDPAPDGGLPNNWIQHFGGPAWTRDEASGQYYLHLFLPEQPDLDWSNPAVGDEFEQILRFWCERGVDGFRIDVAAALVKDPRLRDNPQLRPLEPGMDPGVAWACFEHRHDLDQNPTVAIYRRWRRVVEPYGAILLGETGPQDPVRLARYHDDGRAMHHTFFLGTAWMGWEPLRFRDAVRGIHLASPDSVAWTIENHDVNRSVTRYGGGDTGRRRALAVTTLFMGLGGLPFLYQGQELGNDNGTVAPGAFADPISVRNPGATSGRDGARSPMAWDGSAHNGFSSGEAVWLPCAPRPGRRHRGRAGRGARVVARAASPTPRHPATHPDLVDADLQWLDADSGLLMALRRGSVVVAGNLDEYPADLTLPAGKWRIVFSSQGDGEGPVDDVVTVPAETTLILDGRPDAVACFVSARTRRPAQSVADGQPGLRVEEVGVDHVDRHLELVTDLGGAVGVEPTRHPEGVQRHDLLDTLVQVEGVLGEHRLGVDVEVDDLLEAERLDDLGLGAEPLVVRVLGHQGGVVDVLGADAGGDRPAEVVAEGGPPLEDLLGQRPSTATRCGSSSARPPR